MRTLVWVALLAGRAVVVVLWVTAMFCAAALGFAAVAVGAAVAWLAHRVERAEPERPRCKSTHRPG